MKDRHEMAHDSGWLFSNVLNLYDALLLMSFGLSILLIIPLLLKRDRQARDVLLSAFIFSQGSMAALTVSMYNIYIGPVFVENYAPFHYIPMRILAVSQGFLLYHYVNSMTGRSFQISSRTNAVWLLLLISAISIELVFQLWTPFQKSIGALLICGVSLPSIYMGVKALQRIWQFDETIKDYFSNIEKVQLAWLRLYATGFVLVWASGIVALFSGVLGYYSLSVEIATFANLPPLILISGLVVHGQVMPLNMQNLTSDSTDKTLEDEKLAEALASYREKIQDLMERVKIYQDPELRLDGLADSLDVSPRTVSTLLNNHYQQNFYDFINRYRVIDAQLQLSDPDNAEKPIQRIFEDAGFNSKTTFNTLFKKLTGKTPSEYRKQAKTGSSLEDIRAGLI